jgi:hypothetical protein
MKITITPLEWYIKLYKQEKTNNFKSSGTFDLETQYRFMCFRLYIYKKYIDGQKK